MKISDFDYKLPRELIAQHQVSPRDSSKLLVLDKETGSIKHCRFFNIVDFLKAGDVLVLNNSKVIPARLLGKREGTDGKAEIFLNKNISGSLWEVIGKNLKIGNKIIFDDSRLEAEVIEKNGGVTLVKFNLSGSDFFKEIGKIGLVPLPPYIKERLQEIDKVNYQTVYAKKNGSVAAPTAGLHFTPELIKKVKKMGVAVLEVTLHVGLGTFAPIKDDDFTKHKIHSENYFVSKKAIEEISNAKKTGRRVIAVGTTATRVLEHISLGPIKTSDLGGNTEIFIYPGYKFMVIDGLITNFHLPKSTLLLLVSAFAGEENIKKAYDLAVKEKYRFFSYGDAMMII